MVSDISSKVKGKTPTLCPRIKIKIRIPRSYVIQDKEIRIQWSLYCDRSEAFVGQYSRTFEIFYQTKKDVALMMTDNIQQDLEFSRRFIFFVTTKEIRPLGLLSCYLGPRPFLAFFSIQTF